eukprot:CAMPEP_0179430598 /NCGR_PEP_ID=MMETSP0799-20121207/15703_1 /TAXON_ID=46947 /ORGANISM="Geminigera cryophila, Strain CCMP2564" /LENGTH=67 /DNA_ID=CAMNT_0021207119 /DNA_START=42 /DNA_END=242 /DNA_ORIENTATION=+
MVYSCATLGSALPVGFDEGEMDRMKCLGSMGMDVFLPLPRSVFCATLGGDFPGGHDDFAAGPTEDRW